MESLVRFLSRIGHLARKQAEALIHEGKVKVGAEDSVSCDGVVLGSEAVRFT